MSSCLINIVQLTNKGYKQLLISLCYKMFLVMGKLMNRLQEQLKNPNTKKDAEDCIKIYNWLKDTDPKGRVWENRWQPMVNVRWEGTYPNSLAIYKPNITGYTLLKGIECSE